ncbi:MAG: hypothetical protein LBI85_05760 [Spirochaetaceae bacterium]|jgi:hypothetical protein|nr:hypothetical protein [Spirochaetaceae bacterium]
MPCPLGVSGKPSGFGDFYTWLRNSCVIVSVNAGNAGTSYLDGLARFAKKLYRNSLAFPTAIEGFPSCVIYDSPRYFDGVLRALGGFNAFALTRSNGAIILAPKSASSLSAFAAYVEAMKDASKIFVTGTEIIAAPERRTPNPGNLVVGQFKALAALRFGMSAVSFDLPRPVRSGLPYGNEP